MHSALNRDPGGHRDALEEAFLADAFPARDDPSVPLAMLAACCILVDNSRRYRPEASMHPKKKAIAGGDNRSFCRTVHAQGSIGTQTLDICREKPEDFEVVSLAAGSNIDLLAEQVAYFK